MQMALDAQERMLLDKLISFETMQMDQADAKDNNMKENLYNLFFQWGEDMFLKNENVEESKANAGEDDF